MPLPTRLATALGVAALAATLFTPSAQAGVVYSEGFSAGTFGPNWTTGDAYWQNCSGQGNCIQASGGQSGGYFRLGTATGPTGPNSQPDHRFFISSDIAVNANATYTLSYYLQDDYAGNSPYTVPVAALINGAQVGGVMRASAGGWNRIDLTWLSGSATTAKISLLNEYQLSNYWANGAGSPGYKDWGYGNDFGVDSISLSCSTDCGRAANALPEPASLLLVSAALVGLGLARRRRG